MFLGLIIESELIQDHQVPYGVLACLDCVEGGIRCCLLLLLIVCLTYNKFVDIVHVCFVDILLPQFLMDILIDTLLFEVVHLCVCVGILKSYVRDDYWHLWFGGGIWGLSHDG